MADADEVELQGRTVPTLVDAHPTWNVWTLSVGVHPEQGFERRRGTRVGFCTFGAQDERREEYQKLVSDEGGVTGRGRVELAEAMAVGGVAMDELMTNPGQNQQQHTQCIGGRPMPPDKYTWIAELLETHPFRFAKTMRDNPHWYTPPHQWWDVGDAVYIEVVSAMRKYGYTEWFGGYPWGILNVNG